MAGYGLNTYTMTERNVAAYEKTGVELDVPVFPVREACLEIYEKNPDINLYNAVLLHPLPEGDCLGGNLSLCHIDRREPQKTGRLWGAQFDCVCAKRGGLQYGLPANANAWFALARRPQRGR